MKKRSDVINSSRPVSANPAADSDRPLSEKAEVAPMLIDEGSLKVGDEISLTIGPELFAPIKYNTFTVGPVRASTTVQPGEDAAAAYRRLRLMLTVLYRTEFELQSAQFLDRVKDVAAQTRHAADE